MAKLISRKIVACYVAYNSADVIEQSLNSIIDLVDFVISVDGAYLGMPATSDYSVDGTQDIVRRIAGKKCQIISPPHRLSEPQKRNLYARLVLDKFPNDWLFMIDSDEVLRDAQNDFKWLHSRDAERYNIVYLKRADKELHRRHVTANGLSLFHPRLYGGIRGLHYAETHGTLRDCRGDKIEPKYPSASLKEAWLHHLHNARSSMRLQAAAYYDLHQRWRYERHLRINVGFMKVPMSYLPRSIVLMVMILMMKLRKE